MPTICKNLYLVNIFNVVTYIFQDLLPIYVMFHIHEKNFKLGKA